MARDTTSRIETAAEAILVPGERVTGSAPCWATQRRGRIPLLLLARQQYVMALTDRRVLVFGRSRKPSARDLVLGKRYESFTLERVRRRRFLMQVTIRAANGNRQVFEFRPGHRDLAGELIARLTPTRAPGADATLPGAQGAGPDHDPAASDLASFGAPPAETRPADAPTADAPSPSGGSPADPADPTDPAATEFWGAK